MYETIEKSNAKMCNEIKKIVMDKNGKQKMSYAQIAADDIVMPDAKKKQSVEKTKAELNEKMSPINLKIANVENRKSGTLVIKSKNVEEREKIKNYEVKVPKEVGMQITIKDMNFKMQENELIEKLKSQNETLKDSKIELIKIYESKKFMGQYLMQK